MPSQAHEVLIEMFRNRPSLAAELLDGPLHDHLPHYDEALLTSAELNDVAPTEYRADAVVTLNRSGATVLAVVIEVQRRVDGRKQRSWPAYVATLYARLGCPVALLVVCPHQPVADWAARPIAIGMPPASIVPMAFGPRQIPVISTHDVARRLPELTVLSVLAHAAHTEPHPLFDALFTALDVIEPDTATLYHDFILTVLPAATRKLLEDYMPTTDYPYKSEWSQRQFAAGEAKGEAKGETRAILTFLEARGVDVPDKARETITACTDLDQLEQWARRAATAERVEDLGGPLLD
ncbi:hypothetical protein FHR83_008838 [Actinoplanes campanulatus]|uniref:Transposase, YhgA-like n=1 Tax=Actinoplanes campanulatus TaxID=113559 RepID=A0A7W5FK18_9ACTN|nr:hypothetical protein [Actinoplanes campanulatus]MBB3101110.1 hypothetical protein [Actinoplanes campanulatus]GGN50917.1 hypothetical protein GCM10010109_90630 [Actinoplanes campanulatus]GID42676.1 hypothetical protein Aca09nite_91820 [Actinoplanes campanulatus]